MSLPAESGRADRLRAVANWVNLTTPLGLLVASIGRAQISRGPRRLWLGERYRLRFPDAGAFTMGSVVIVPNGELATLTARHPGVLEHEAAHARQWACCLGLPFLPLYLLANLWSWLLTGTWHGANPFEVRAGLAKGGYVPAPRRPVWRRIGRR